MNSAFGYGLLPIRIIAGVTFIADGVPKSFGVSGGIRFLSICKFTPELFVPIAHLELIGGLAILLGILTRIASVLLIIELLGAILTIKLSKGFIGGYEFELLLIAICLSLVIMGPGKISIENAILRREIFSRGKQLSTDISSRH